MTIVDRSADPVHVFSYAVPFEDMNLTEDEVVGSRTHQFLAFCRDRYASELLPNWITEADLAAAVDKGLGDPAEVDLDQHVLEGSTLWTGCWTRVTGDDERRPISFASAAEPVAWDTSALAAGTWVLDGYTYEPWTNLWAAHPGVFKIVDDPDPAASAPAASLDFPEQQVSFGESVVLSGCVDAMAGTTMRLSWGLATVNEAPDWVEFASDLPAESGAFELEFEAPIEAASSSVLIRMALEDPMGRSWVAYSRSAIGVLDGGGDEDCGGGFVGGDCGESESGSESGESSAGDESGLADEGPASGEDGAGACNCRTHESDRRPPWLWGLGLALVGLTPRRRAHERALSSR